MKYLVLNINFWLKNHGAQIKIIDFSNTDVFRYEFNVFEDLSSQWIREQRKFLYNKNEMCGPLTKSKLKNTKNINILLEKIIGLHIFHMK